MIALHLWTFKGKLTFAIIDFLFDLMLAIITKVNPQTEPSNKAYYF